MAITSNTFTGNGSNTLFSFTFPYLETSDIDVYINGVLTTAYTFANETTVQMNTAPANGATILIKRSTDDTELQATFFPGSSIKASDLNLDFNQALYINQETVNAAADATSTANTALTNANTAVSTANSAVSTANTALSTANAAVVTANTAESNSLAAVSTANTASSNASAAVSTANAASATAASAVSTANSAVSTANSAVSTANSAVSTANTALSNSNTAISTANAADANATAAVATANAADANATAAVSTANSAVSTANSAVSTANTALSNSTTAISTANAAVAAVASAVIYVPVADLASLALYTPANGDYFELQDSTGAESDPSITGVPVGLVGAPGLTFRLRYDDPPQEYVFLGYFANDSETRYLKLAGGTLTGQLLGDNSTNPSTPGFAFDGDANTGVGTTGADELALVTGGTARLTIDSAGAISIPGTQTVTGSSTAASFIPTGSSVPTNGLYLPAANSVAISTNGTGRLFIDSTGRVGIGTSVPDQLFHISSGTNTRAKITTTSTSSFGQLYIGDDEDKFLVGYGSTHPNQPDDLALRNATGGIFFATGTSTSTERVRIDSSGRVGIGTTTPGSLLHLGFTQSHIHFEQEGTSNKALIRATRTTDKSNRTLNIGGSEVAFLIGSTATTALSSTDEKARFDNSGRLLVGTSSSSYASRAVFQGNSGDPAGTGNIRLTSGTTSPANGADLGAINFADSSHRTSAVITGTRDGGTWTSETSQPSRLAFFTTADGAGSPTERMRIDSSGNVGLGGINPLVPLDIRSAQGTLNLNAGSDPLVNLNILNPDATISTGPTIAFSSYYSSTNSGPLATIAVEREVGVGTGSNALSNSIIIRQAQTNSTGLTERLRIDSSGRLLVGTSTSRAVGGAAAADLQVEVAGAKRAGSFVRNGGTPIISLGTTGVEAIGDVTLVSNGDVLGQIEFSGADGTDLQSRGAAISAEVDGTPGANDMPGRLVFSTTADGASSPTRRMTIKADGSVIFGDYDSAGGTGTGGKAYIDSTAALYVAVSDNTVGFFNRNASDGGIVVFRQANVTEGTISVSGTTVTYGGGHLARWSQLPNNEDPSGILKGTVMTNLDEMCEWGDEDNEQLNKTKISDVEGDPNVAGVFVATSFDDEGPLDFFVGMTGDMVIRIAEGVTVERGDLLMSAGDGTAKPQDDDIIRSKTIAKVTSTNVSCTYDDGSYCVPCVLMAC